MDNQTIGIIGLGSFGKLIADIMPAKSTILAYDLANSSHKRAVMSRLAEVAATDIVFLAVPLKAYPKILPALRDILPESTLLVDICSVKIKPAQLLKKHLPNHKNLLLTHPLFGPQTAKPGQTKGHELIVTESSGTKAETLIQYFKDNLGLVISRSTNELHDKAMAQVHAVTFFVAKALSLAEIGKNVPYITPSFKMVLDLIKLENRHSDGLFETIQLGNPYASHARQALLDSLEKVQSQLQNEDK